MLVWVLLEASAVLVGQLLLPRPKRWYHWTLLRLLLDLGPRPLHLRLLVKMLVLRLGSKLLLRPRLSLQLRRSLTVPEAAWLKLVCVLGLAAVQRRLPGSRKGARSALCTLRNARPVPSTPCTLVSLHVP